MNAKWLLLGLLCSMNNKKYKKWAQRKPQENNMILGMYLPKIKRIYGFLIIIPQYLLVSLHIVYACQLAW